MLAVAGLVIAIRLVFGPFDFVFSVRSPLNAEGWFGLALTILLVTARGSTNHRGTHSPHPRYDSRDTVAVASLIGLTVCAFWRSTDLYFLSDDFVLIKLAHEFQFGIREVFARAGGDGFFRPVGHISLALTSAYAGVDPKAWHATAIALHAANVVLVFQLVTQLSAARLTAFFAAALFALHGTRPEAVAWIAGRFDLASAFFTLAGLVLFAHSGGSGDAAGHVLFSRLASMTCMVLAILCKESAFVFPVLLVLLLFAKRDSARSRIAALAPFFVTAATFFVYRLWLLGGIGGYRDPVTGKLQALTFGFATLKALGLRLWAVLSFPINWSSEPGAWLTALTLAYVAGLLWLAATRPNRALLGFGIGWILVSALPPLHLLGIGADLWNSRLLYLPSSGFCMMMAATAEGLRGWGRWLVPALVLTFHFAALQHNLDQWQFASDKAKVTAPIAAQCLCGRGHSLAELGVPDRLRGVPFFANVHSDHLQSTGNKQRAPVAGCHWDERRERLEAVKTVN